MNPFTNNLSAGAINQIADITKQIAIADITKQIAAYEREIPVVMARVETDASAIFGADWERAWLRRRIEALCILRDALVRGDLTASVEETTQQCPSATHDPD